MSGTITNPWDVLPRKAVGDPHNEPLFIAVGQALSAWELLDNAQADLFGRLVNSRQGSAEAAYGTVMASSGRTEMVIVAADRLFAGIKFELFQEMKSLLEQIGKMSGRRNEIAHGIVTLIDHNEKSLGYYLAPASYNTRKISTMTQMREYFQKYSSADEMTETEMLTYYKYLYTSNQVTIYANHFLNYRDSVWSLISKVDDAIAVLFPSNDKPQ